VNRNARLLEAALFSASQPLGLDELRRLLSGASKNEVADALEELRQHLNEHEHGVELGEVAGGFQLLTRTEFAEEIAAARIVQRPRRLSRAALETLAVIAYRQPVSRAEVEEIRGVSVEGVLRLLLEREFVEVAGRAEGMGRPLLYRTTVQFLELLGLNDLNELPKLEDLSVALRPPMPQPEL
jgi:segregation and condensation protein B